MKKLILFLLILFVFSIQRTTEGPARYDTYTLFYHDWTTPEAAQEKGDYLIVSASKQFSITRDGNQSTPVYYASAIGSARAEVSTELMGVGNEWTCISWIQATSAQGLTSVPSKDFIPHTVTGPAEQSTKGTPYATNLGKAESIISFKRGIAAVYHKKGGIIPSGEIVRIKFIHGKRKSATGEFISATSHEELPHLNPWAHVSIDITGRAHAGLQPDINLASASTPKCNEEHPMPLGIGIECPGTPGEDYTEPNNEIVNQQGNASSPTDSSTPETAMHACGIHATTESGNHSSITPPCGDSAHAGYACQISSDHNTAMSGWSGPFYECQPHTDYTCGHTDPTANAAYHAHASCGISGHHVCDNNSHVAANCGQSGHYVCDSLTHVEEQCTNVSNGVRCRYKFWRCLHPNVPSYGPSHTCDYSAP